MRKQKPFITKDDIRLVKDLIKRETSTPEKKKAFQQRMERELKKAFGRCNHKAGTK